MKSRLALVLGLTLMMPNAAGAEELLACQISFTDMNSVNLVRLFNKEDGSFTASSDLRLAASIDAASRPAAKKRLLDQLPIEARFQWDGVIDRAVRQQSFTLTAIELSAPVKVPQMMRVLDPALTLEVKGRRFGPWTAIDTPVSDGARFKVLAGLAGSEADVTLSEDELKTIATALSDSASASIEVVERGQTIASATIGVPKMEDVWSEAGGWLHDAADARDAGGGCPRGGGR